MSPAEAKAALALFGRSWKAGEELTDEEAAEEWNAVESLRAPLVEGEAPSIEAVLDAAAERIVEAVREIESSTKAEAEEVAVDLVFDASAFISEVELALGATVAAALELGLESGALRIGEEVSELVASIGPEGRAVLAEIVDKTKEITDTTKQLIERVVEQGIEERVSAGVVADRLAELFDEINPSRAEAIAQTSVTGAFEAGQLDAFTAAGIERKGWLSQRDGNVREAHAEADRQIVAIGETFTVGGESLRFPGDPRGSASNVIRCRCTSRPILESDTEA